MMDYFFFMLCLLSLYNLKLKGINQFFPDYLNLENTNSIKGIFVWLIIFCHKSQYGINKNYLFIKIIGHLGQKVVSMFLFYSGFGISESLKKKGFNYAKTLPKKSLILFLKYQIILLIYLTTNIFIFNNKITLKIYFLSVIFKYSLGNSNWFAFTIIIFYNYSYLSFRFINNNIYIGIIIISFISILHTILVYSYFYPGKIYAIDTVFCFITGFSFSCMKIYLDKLIMKNDICYFLITSIIIIIYYKFHRFNTIIYISIRNSIFSLIIILISIKVKINNDFLIFINSHSFSIYLLQRLVFWIDFRKKIFVNSDFIQMSFEFTTILFMASLFDKYILF
jgi:hypothetical protein